MRPGTGELLERRLIEAHTYTIQLKNGAVISDVRLIDDLVLISRYIDLFRHAVSIYQPSPPDNLENPPPKMHFLVAQEGFAINKITFSIPENNLDYSARISPLTEEDWINMNARVFWTENVNINILEED